MRHLFVCVGALLAFMNIMEARPKAAGNEKCKSGQLDLVFIIDGSRSVRPHEFETMRKFMIDIINELDISPNGTHVGVVQYSSQVQNVFSLKQFITHEDMVKAIKEIIPLAQGTMTGHAISYAMNVAFSADEGARPSVPQVAVIVTDGRPQDRVAQVATAARESGIEIYAVGVARADMTSLRAMASPPFEDHVFLVESFDLIHHFGLQFQDKLCKIDLCVESDHGCDHVCEGSPGSYQCICLPGYTLHDDGKSCTAIDLCGEEKHDCEQICINSPGSFNCDCNTGYALNEDKRTCKMIDYCSFGNHSCEHECVSVLNGFNCQCNEGHILNDDKRKCTMIDYCTFGNDSCEHECVSVLQSFYCQCNEGYILNEDATTCSEDNLCNAVEHGCQHQCVSAAGSYHCICPKGHLLQEDGKSCGSCRSANIDLVFLIDGSKSVRPQNFELVKQFVNQVVDQLDISAHGTHVGLVQYSSRVRTEFPLNMYKSKEEIKAAVMKVAYMEKGTMTGLALKHMVQDSFSEAEGARATSRNIPRVGLVFTDGRSQDDITEWATKAKEAGITIYAVGVGKAVENELREIASEPVAKHFFYTSDFTAINQIAENLKINICPEESQGAIEMKDPCACGNLVEFQQATMVTVKQLKEKPVTTRLEHIEKKLLRKK